jgi:tRNA dimethylallyltransferase
MKKRIIIAGPTASGKSSLAISLAQKVDGEIISVDSRQCYRHINIGTAKPTKEQLALIPHHNISALDLEESDNVADFKVRAEQAAIDITKRGKTILFCGGSTLHLQSLIKPIDDIPSANSENIEKLQQEANESGIQSLYNRLLEHDPEYASSMDGYNKQRIMRALDVWIQTGRPFSSFHNSKKTELPSEYLFFALHHPRKVIHNRIEIRTDKMITEGLVEETRKLLESGYSQNIQALQTVGYKQAIQYLHNEISHDQMVADIKTATRRYAKRQITWLRRWDFVDWIDMSSKNEEAALQYMQDQVAAKP